MPEQDRDERESAPVRSFWSGTITFGLVSIPVDLFAAARPRQKSMKMVDKDGHALGRQYRCSKEGKKLSNDDLVRGFETESGEVIVVTDEELESVAPETSRDIELKRFVPFEQIAPIYFDRPYFLAPAGRSAKAYNLLAKTMERSGRVAIGSFVMRGHEYLIAILSENGVLRAETLRHADEIRTPEFVGLPKRTKGAAKLVNELIKEIDGLMSEELNMAELEDREAEALQDLAQAKRKKGEDVIEQTQLEDEDAQESGGAQIIDLMAVLRKSLAKNAIVTTARDSEPQIERRPPKRASKAKTSTPPKKAAAKDDSLGQASKSELYKKAAELEIPGRSKMDRDALLEAIRGAN